MVNTVLFLSIISLTIGLVTKITCEVPILEQELLTLPKHMISVPAFSEISVSQS